MEDLIKALRDAPEPSRELDARIENLFGLEHALPTRRYTYSLDHALMLAPAPSDNWAINTEPCGYYATITTVRAKREYDEMIESQWDIKTHAGQVTEKGATPAMAVCIAALNARLHFNPKT